jgi:hypothetical protein
MPIAVDILILSNGPGELATWVKPVVQELRHRLGNDRQQVRISVVLSPCSNANGQEATVARRYPEVDRVQAAEHFFPFLLWGQTADHWDWHDRGVVLFLGGDQFFAVAIGKRLGYRTVIYAEWEARWHRWIDRFGVMQPGILDRAPAQYVHKLTVIGDLMAEVGKGESGAAANYQLIGLLPGSKAAKLNLGLPLMLAIAEQIQAARPEVRFVIPVAPTLEATDLARFADPEHNPLITSLGWTAATLTPDRTALKTASGLVVDLHTSFPAYDLLTQCCLCLTIIGANTAELGSLAVPMLVLLPTQQLDAMRSWDGLPGLLSNLPGVGSGIAKLINWMALRRLGLLAWPNIWAGREVVPELVGHLEPPAVAAQVLDYLAHPEKLQQMQADLRSVRGAPGAAAKLVTLVCEELEQTGQ